MQGQFKRPVCMDSLVFGQEFTHKLCNLPAPWFIDNMLLPLARKISPALRVGNLEQPYLYSPLITASQVGGAGKTRHNSVWLDSVQVPVPLAQLLRHPQFYK